MECPLCQTPMRLEGRSIFENAWRCMRCNATGKSTRNTGIYGGGENWHPPSRKV